jgi:plastocyanin
VRRHLGSRPGGQRARLAAGVVASALGGTVPVAVAHSGQPRAVLSFPTLGGARIHATQPTPPVAGLAPGHPSPPSRLRAVRLLAFPAAPEAGQRVRLAVVAPPAGATAFAWDLTGTDAYRHPIADSRAVTSFRSVGVHSVAVRFHVGDRTETGVLRLTVRARPRTRARRDRAGEVAAPVFGGAGGRPAKAAATPDPVAASHPETTSKTSAGLVAQVTADVAGDPGVTVADYQFTPGSTTIHVGDTITWTNNGPSAHTATAHNGSFNTGVLQKGQSASHTFTQPGTYTYYCQIHPFMHGTIVVLAGTAAASQTATTTGTQTSTTPTQTSTTSAQSAAAQTTTSSSTGAASSGTSNLPVTGSNVFEGVAVGLLLFGLGAALRRVRAS